MRHRKNKTTLDRKSAARNALLKSLVLSLIYQGQIPTTLAKAKAMRPAVERMVTHGKEDTITNRRYLMQRLQNDGAVTKMVKEIGPKYATRQGGYTRIIKLPQRVGDGSPQALIEFV